MVGWWQAFDFFDKDRSGYIDSAELRGILREVGQEVTDEELREMMSLADSNGSGKMDVGIFCAVEEECRTCEHEALLAWCHGRG